MSMLTPSSSRHRPRRAPRFLAAVLVLLLAAAAAYWFLYRDTGTGTVALPCPSSSTAPSATPHVVPAAVAVRVLNSTKRNHLASQTATVLAQRGFTITQVGNATDPAPVPGPAQLRYGPSGAAGARLLAQQLLASQPVPDGRADASVDLVLGTAFVRLRTPTEVAAAAASAAAAGQRSSPSAPSATAASPRCRASGS